MTTDEERHFYIFTVNFSITKLIKITIETIKY